jgi:hypothetical protein
MPEPETRASAPAAQGAELSAAIRSQYEAALHMTRQAIEACPEPAWDDAGEKNRFWHVAYHALFFTHLYLHDSYETFRPWSGHRPEYQFLGKAPGPPPRAARIGAALSKAEVLGLLSLVQAELPARLAALTPGAPSGFHWLSFDKLELHLYSIRHLQHHTGQLVDRLRERHGISIAWVFDGRAVPSSAKA